MKHDDSQIDGLQATNILLLVPVDGGGAGSCKGCSNVNCAGRSACHLWGAGFGDRNGIVQINGSHASFRVQSWPATESKPVGPGQTGPGQCLTPVGSGPLTEGTELRMSPCSPNALQLSLAGESLRIHSAVPTADPLCLGAPPPPPSPPPGRPNHWFSCTQNLAGGPRLTHAFCNASLPEDERLDNLLSLATCAEKSAAVTSSGQAIPRLGVPQLGAAEDTHGVGGGCMPATAAANGSTGCPTTFPAGPGLGATFSRELWAAIGATIGLEARGLNNQGVNLGSRCWGQKMGSEDSRLAERERGVWFWSKRDSICTPHLNRKNEPNLFRGRKTRICPHILEPRCQPVVLPRP